MAWIGAFAVPSCGLGALQYTGVSLAGAEFGDGTLPGTFNQHYTYPTAAEIDYFVGQGLNTFRIPLRWERLQRSLSAPLHATELGRLETVVSYATSKGASVILDPHNYARYWVGGRPAGTETVIGTGAVTNTAFADFWSRLANEFKDNDRVIFGLMNEPHSMPTEQWRDSANTAIAAIRDTGAPNLIFVPGNAWSGAHSWTQNWYGTPNAQVMLTITDPLDNFAFEVHQYLDSNSSGGSSEIVSETIGRERLVQFTQWLETHNRRGFLGEFAVANSRIGNGATDIGDEAIHNMLNYMEAHDDVWLGWTWWAAGPWWSEYQFTLEPTNLGLPNQADRPAMAVLRPHLALPILAGDYNDDGTVDAADYVVWRDNIGGGSITNETVTPGSVDEADYMAWRANFGAESTSATTTNANLAAIPEPASVALLLLALVQAGASVRFAQSPKASTS